MPRVTGNRVTWGPTRVLARYVLLVTCGTLLGSLGYPVCRHRLYWYLVLPVVTGYSYRIWVVLPMGYPCTRYPRGPLGLYQGTVG